MSPLSLICARPLSLICARALSLIRARPPPLAVRFGVRVVGRLRKLRRLICEAQQDVSGLGARLGECDRVGRRVVCVARLRRCERRTLVRGIDGAPLALARHLRVLLLLGAAPALPLYLESPRVERVQMMPRPRDVVDAEPQGDPRRCQRPLERPPAERERMETEGSILHRARQPEVELRELDESL